MRTSECIRLVSTNQANYIVLALSYLKNTAINFLYFGHRLGAWGVGWKRRSIKLERDYNISYVERGEAGGDDRPTVLFIHGYGGNADNWNLVVKVKI